MEYQVTFDYIAKEKDELSIKTGDIIKSVVKAFDGWLEGDLNGKIGIFPENFGILVAKATTSDNSITKKSNLNKSFRRLRVLFDYSAEQEDELTLKIGDIIYYKHDVEDGWWRGSLNEKIGIFPSNFVTEMDSPQSIDNIKAEPEAKLKLFKKHNTSSKNKGSSRLLNEYTVDRVLGEGGFGLVLECSYNLDKSKYAVKITASEDEEFAMKEVQNFVKVSSHKNLVQYNTCWKDRLSSTSVNYLKQMLQLKNSESKLMLLSSNLSLHVICIQMELCGEDLRSSMQTSRTVNEQKSIGIFIQLLRGVEHLHKNEIIHRDLKPENIFTSKEGIIKIGDLGLATTHSAINSLNHSAGVGCPLYMAPEQVGYVYGSAVDIYALGVIFLELLHPSVQPGFNNGSKQPLIDMVLIDLKHYQKVPVQVSTKWPVATNIILKMTSIDSKERPGCTQICETFSESNSKPAVLRKDSTTNKPAQLDPLLTHFLVRCGSCDKQDFSGIRYKCTVCDDYDLCEGCEARNGIHPESHLFVKIKTFSNSTLVDLVPKNKPVANLLIDSVKFNDQFKMDLQKKLAITNMIPVNYSSLSNPPSSSTNKPAQQDPHATHLHVIFIVTVIVIAIFMRWLARLFRNML